MCTVGFTDFKGYFGNTNIEKPLKRCKSQTYSQINQSLLKTNTLITAH